MSKPKKTTPSASTIVVRAAYRAALEAGLLRNGRPVRPGQTFTDRRKAASAGACRGKARDE